MDAVGALDRSRETSDPSSPGLGSALLPKPGLHLRERLSDRAAQRRPDVRPRLHGQRAAANPAARPAPHSGHACHISAVARTAALRTLFGAAAPLGRPDRCPGRHLGGPDAHVLLVPMIAAGRCTKASSATSGRTCWSRMNRVTRAFVL